MRKPIVVAFLAGVLLSGTAFAATEAQRRAKIRALINKLTTDPASVTQNERDDALRFLLLRDLGEEN